MDHESLKESMINLGRDIIKHCDPEKASKEQLIMYRDQAKIIITTYYNLVEANGFDENYSIDAYYHRIIESIVSILTALVEIINKKLE